MIDKHKFCMETIRFQDEVTTLALNKAERIKKTCKLPNIFALRICRAAYKKFKESLEQTFPSEDYKRLLSMTVDSRINYFYVELEEKVLNILKEANSSSSSNGIHQKVHHLKKSPDLEDPTEMIAPQESNP